MSFHSTLTSTDLHVGPTIKHNGSTISARRNINFLDTGSFTWITNDDSGNDEVEVSGTASGSGSGLTQDQILNIAMLRA